MDDKEKPKDNVIQLVPKVVQDAQKDLQQTEELYLRKQRCYFKNTYTTEGCKCNYCVYVNMLGQRVYEMIMTDMQYQSKKGTMILSTQDCVDSLQIALEKIIKYEEQRTKKT